MKKEIKKYLKRLLSLTVATVMSVSFFTGCKNNASDKNEQGQTVISVGDWPDKQGTALDNMNARKARFEESNPDVAVEPDLWKFERKTFYAKAAGGQLPLVYRAGFTEVSEIMSSEYSADLTEVLKKRGYEGMFNPRVLEAVSRDGKIYAFPKNAAVMGLMINTDLYKEAGLMEEDGTPKQPKTWDDVVEFAVKIKESTGKPGFVIPTANKSGGWLFTCLAWSFGADFMEKDLDGNWKATFNTPEAIAALQFVKDMKWKYDILPSNTLIDSGEWQKIFGTGTAGITFAAGEYPSSAVYKYGIQPMQIGLIAMPEGPKKHVTMLSGDILCVSQDATEDQIDAAIRWIETEVSYKITDNLKQTITEQRNLQVENNQIVGIKGISIWNNDAETVKFERALIDQKTNTNPNYVKLYNEFAANCPCEIRAEEPVCPQELYAILDGCIQEVLTKEDADCAQIMEKANLDFQKDYLDNMTY